MLGGAGSKGASKGEGDGVHGSKSWQAADGDEADEEDEEDEEEEDEQGGGKGGAKEAAGIGARIKRKDGMEMEVTFVSGALSFSFL